MRQQINKAKRWVIKVGTSTLTTPDGHFSARQLDNIVSQVAMLLKKEVEVILVSSGAIALGMDTLKRTKRPTLLPELQACAAIGQGKLMKAYETAFSNYGFHAAQILLTQDGLQDRKKYLNARKRWLANSASSQGKIILDDGACRALKENGRSLLPGGF